MKNIHKRITQLSKKERLQLQIITHKGKHSARVITRARILLLTYKNQAKDDIASQLDIGRSTVQRVRDRFREGGLDRALYDAPRPGQPPKITDTDEATLVALACSQPPKHEDRWTLELLTKEYNKGRKKKKRVTSATIWYRLHNRGIKPWREKNVVYTDDNA